MKSRERFIAACRCRPTDRPPVWLMRQAGRYLPGYQELRGKYGFVELCRRPDLAARISLEPWERFGMDAVIVFSDILIPVRPMGVGLDFVDGRGVVLDRRIESARDVAALASVHPRTSLGFVLDTLTGLRHEIKDEAALLGFVGSPWTIACYMIEGGSGEFTRAIEAAKTKRDMIEPLLDHLTQTIADYAVEQARSGCDAIQIFDTWGGLLEAGDYEELVLPKVRRICDAILGAGSIPILFIRGSEGMLPQMKRSGAGVISLGPETKLSEAWNVLGDGIATQGNLNPEILLGPAMNVASATERLLSEIGDRPGHIVNLGHGVLPGTKPECVKAMVDTVKNSVNSKR